MTKEKRGAASEVEAGEDGAVRCEGNGAGGSAVERGAVEVAERDAVERPFEPLRANASIRARREDGDGGARGDGEGVPVAVARYRREARAVRDGLEPEVEREEQVGDGVVFTFSGGAEDERRPPGAFAAEAGGLCEVVRLLLGDADDFDAVRECGVACRSGD